MYMSFAVIISLIIYLAYRIDPIYKPGPTAEQGAIIDENGHNIVIVNPFEENANV